MVVNIVSKIYKDSKSVAMSFRIRRPVGLWISQVGVG